MATTEMAMMFEAIRQLAEQVKSMAEANQSSGGSKLEAWDSIAKYKNITLFTGDAKMWDEFSTKFRSQVAAGARGVEELMKSVETEVTEKQAEHQEWEDLADGRCTVDQVQEVAVKLYNVLLSITTAEANAVVRRCRGNGLWAWKRLSTTLNPRTLASGVKCISQVLAPTKITNASKADVAIEAWEDRVAKLAIEYGEEISAKMKVAVLYAMLPKDLQERVLDKCAVNWDGAKEEEAASIYHSVKEDVKNIAKSRRDMSMPKPMEVDRVRADWGWWCGGWNDEDEENNEYKDKDKELQTEEKDVNFIGKGKSKGKGKGECWTCGEVGHRAADCPKGNSGKSYGKGGWSEKGGWKGRGGWYGKDGWNGKGAEYKTGKGGWAPPMVKACFGCGSTAHLMRDCPNKEGQRVQQVETDGPEVLYIGHTNANVEEHWHLVDDKYKHRAKRCEHPPGLATPGCNGFRVLAEDEEDEEEEPVETCHIHDIESNSTDNNKAAVKTSGIRNTEWASLGVGEIAVDSAADESCWPKGLGDAFKLKPSKRNIVLKTANGGEMGHYGEKDITFKTGNSEDVVGLKFQVTDVKKPLLAVRRLVEKGNVVSFGPEPDQNYIRNIATGRKIEMEKKGGAFVIKAHFMKEMADASSTATGFTRQVR